MRRGAADLDIGPVRFEYPGHRVLTAPVIVVVIIVVVPVAHPLVVLTVSHVSPFIPALKSYAVAIVVSSDPGACLRAPNQDAVQIHVIDVANPRVQQRRVPQPPAFTASRTNHSACQNKPKNRTRSGVTIFRETVCS